MLPHDQHEPIRHGGANVLEELLGEVGASPFAVDGALVKAPVGQPPADRVQINVLQIGSREIEVPLDEGTTLMELTEKFHLSKLIGSGLRIAIDGEITEKMDQPLSDSTEVAFLPPVSGG